MIVAAQLAIMAASTAEIVIELQSDFLPKAVSMTDSRHWNVVSLRIGDREFIHDKNPVIGQTLVDLFPQLETEWVSKGSKIVMLVTNITPGCYMFSCSFAGLDR